VRVADERGAALFIALLVAVILGALAAGLVAVTITETMISSAHRSVQEAAFAAEAGLERAIHDLATVSDWSSVLSAPPANLTSTFMDGLSTIRTPDGRTFEVASLTSERQRTSDARDGPSLAVPDWPLWRLYAQGSLDRLPSPGPVSPAYLLVWVADDGEGDGDPGVDSNGQILVHAEAYGASGARRGVEAAIRRAQPPVVQVLARRPVR
jgi:hypothetical protein